MIIQRLLVVLDHSSEEGKTYKQVGDIFLLFYQSIYRSLSSTLRRYKDLCWVCLVADGGFSMSPSRSACTVVILSHYRYHSPDHSPDHSPSRCRSHCQYHSPYCIEWTVGTSRTLSRQKSTKDIIMVPGSFGLVESTVERSPYLVSQLEILTIGRWPGRGGDTRIRARIKVLTRKKWMNSGWQTAFQWSYW